MIIGGNFRVSSATDFVFIFKYLICFVLIMSILRFFFFCINNLFQMEKNEKPFFPHCPLMLSLQHAGLHISCKSISEFSIPLANLITTMTIHTVLITMVFLAALKSGQASLFIFFFLFLSQIFLSLVFPYAFQTYFAQFLKTNKEQYMLIVNELRQFGEN